MTDLESRIKNRLSKEGMTIQRLATESGISEPTIHAIFNRGDAKISQLDRIAKALKIPLNFLLSDAVDSSFYESQEFNQTDDSDTQQRKVTRDSPHESASALAVCQRALEVTRELMAGQTQIITSLRDQLKTKDALIAAKEETITLLRTSYNRPS